LGMCNIDTILYQNWAKKIQKLLLIVYIGKKLLFLHFKDKDKDKDNFISDVKSILTR